MGDGIKSENSRWIEETLVYLGKMEVLVGELGRTELGWGCMEGLSVAVV